MKKCLMPAIFMLAFVSYLGYQNVDVSNIVNTLDFSVSSSQNVDVAASVDYSDGLVSEQAPANGLTNYTQATISTIYGDIE